MENASLSCFKTILLLGLLTRCDGDDDDDNDGEIIYKGLVDTLQDAKAFVRDILEAEKEKRVGTQMI